MTHVHIGGRSGRGKKPATRPREFCGDGEPYRQSEQLREQLYSSREPLHSIPSRAAPSSHVLRSRQVDTRAVKAVTWLKESAVHCQQPVQVQRQQVQARLLRVRLQQQGLRWVRLSPSPPQRPLRTFRMQRPERLLQELPSAEQMLAQQPSL